MKQFTKLTYFKLFIIILIVEISIALFADHGFVRGFIGDVLVVFLIYYFIQFIIQGPPIKIAVLVLLFAFLVEVLQLFKIVELLGLQNNAVAKTIIGTTFSYLDLLAYFLGTGLLLFVQFKFKKT